MLPSPLYKRKTLMKVVVQRPLDKVAFSFLYFKEMLEYNDMFIL